MTAPPLPTRMGCLGERCVCVDSHIHSYSKRYHSCTHSLSHTQDEEDEYLAKLIAQEGYRLTDSGCQVLTGLLKSKAVVPLSGSAALPPSAVPTSAGAESSSSDKSGAEAAAGGQPRTKVANAKHDTAVAGGQAQTVQEGGMAMKSLDDATVRQSLLAAVHACKGLLSGGAGTET